MLYFWVFIVNPFSFSWVEIILFSWKLCFLWSPFLFIIAEWIISDTSGEPNVGFFLKITSPCWIILSISLDELNSIDWLLKTWWWTFLKKNLFYCCKRILIWKKYNKGFLKNLFEYYFLNIIFWKLLRISTSLVIWNLHITVSTTRKYCYK